MEMRRRKEPRSGGLFHITGRGARIAVRGGRNSRLIAAGTAAGRGALGTPPPDAGGGGILEFLAHAVELGGVIGTEATALEGGLLAVTSTTTAHRT